MDPLTPGPEEVDPSDARVAPLIVGHLTLMRASSPACSVHAMDADRLAKAGAQFFAIFDGEEAVAMGALKRLSDGSGELKSMHVRVDRRGAGLAHAMLGHLIDRARDQRMPRLYLETGSQEVFFPARQFYARHGFSTCAPFEGYETDPNSVFMTRAI